MFGLHPIIDLLGKTQRSLDKLVPIPVENADILTANQMPRPIILRLLNDQLGNRVLLAKRHPEKQMTHKFNGLPSRWKNIHLMVLPINASLWRSRQIFLSGINRHP